MGERFDAALRSLIASLIDSSMLNATIRYRTVSGERDARSLGDHHVPEPADFDTPISILIISDPDRR
jgi:hypothetical protein